MRNSSLAGTLSGRPFHHSASHHDNWHDHRLDHRRSAPQGRAGSWREGLTRGAVSLSAMAAAGLAAALTFPGAARAETGGAPRAFSLTAEPAAPIGPQVEAGAARFEQGTNLLGRLASAAAAPPRRFAVPHLRIESGTDNGVMAAYRLSDYDLRLEYGTVFYHSAAVPFQRSDPQVLRTRLMSRVVTRF